MVQGGTCPADPNGGPHTSASDTPTTTVHGRKMYQCQVCNRLFGFAGG